ncbi:hypothetical protein [Fimbriimonas ginsengisoli]|nr:hypothetical protein [Fimbriimonas ginsengisoli]
MRRILCFAAIAALALTSGCGGSGSSDNSPAGDTTAPFAAYSATLPDGGTLDLAIHQVAEVPGTWEGSFEESSSTNDAEDVAGIFSGTRSGNSFTATFFDDDDTSFTASGTYHKDGTIHATRSDMPGVELVFRPVARVVAGPSRGSRTFKLKVRKNVDAIVTVETTPTVEDSSVAYYNGKCNDAWISVGVRKVRKRVDITAFYSGSSIYLELPATTLDELFAQPQTSTLTFGRIANLTFNLPADAGTAP